MRENNDIKVKVKLQRRAINIFRVLTVIINQQEQKDSYSEEIDQPLVKLQKPSNDSTYQTQSKTKQDSSKQLPQEKQQNVKFKQLKMNRQLKLILKS